MTTYRRYYPKRDTVVIPYPTPITADSPLAVRLSVAPNTLGPVGDAPEFNLWYTTTAQISFTNPTETNLFVFRYFPANGQLDWNIITPGQSWVLPTAAYFLISNVGQVSMTTTDGISLFQFNEGTPSQNVIQYISILSGLDFSFTPRPSN